MVLLETYEEFFVKPIQFCFILSKWFLIFIHEYYYYNYKLHAIKNKKKGSEIYGIFDTICFHLNDKDFSNDIYHLIAY